MALITKRDFILAVIFTIVEIITLTAWIIAFDLPLKNGLLAGAVLSAGLFIEHIISRIKG